MKVKRKSVVRTLIFAMILLYFIFTADFANATVLNVAISPAGDKTFPEDTILSGQVIWSVEDDLAIPNASYDIYVTFEIMLELTDPDNIPANPSVSELSLWGWPTEFGETVPWTFEWMSGAIGGPRNTWHWSATLVVTPTDNRPAFLAGQDIATANWSTGGEDVDDIADCTSFRMRPAIFIVLATSPDWLIWHSDYDASFFNPEPIPEPATVAILGVGALALLRRRGVL